MYLFNDRYIHDMYNVKSSDPVRRDCTFRVIMPLAGTRIYDTGDGNVFTWDCANVMSLDLNPYQHT